MSNSMKTHDLIITHVFDAAIEQVWKAWTDPGFMTQWWGPDGFTSPSARVDFRVDGKSILCMRAPEEHGGQDSYSTWFYTSIEPLKRIEFVHNLSDSQGNKLDPASVGMPADFPHDQRQTVDFKDLGGGKTEVIVTEYEWPEGQMMEYSEIGMKQCLNKMAAVLAQAGQQET